MTTVLVIAIVAAVGAGVYWVWRASGAEQREEAFKGQNKALEEHSAALNRALLEAAERKAREDRLNAEEIVRTGDAAGAREFLRNAQGRKSN